MSKKSDAELDRISKVDLLRTGVTFLARDGRRRALNDLEDKVNKEHDRRVNEGLPTGIDAENLLSGITRSLTGLLGEGDGQG